MSRLRAAVRRALDEAWLAAQAAPHPSAEVVERVRTAVSEELGSARLPGSASVAVTGSGRSSVLLRWLSTQGWASLAAAAMLLVCVGIIRYAASKPNAAAVDDVGVLVEFLSPVSATDSIRYAVLSLEADLNEDELSLTGDDESLEDLVREMDQILEENESGRRTSGPHAVERGVLG